MRGRSRLTVLLAVVAAALAVLAAALYQTQYRSDQGVDDRARAEVAQVAADGAAALLTYTPESVAADMYAAQQRLTGDFKDYYGRYVDTVVVPAAQDNKISQRATVTGSGVSSFDAEHAVVLVFLTQATSTANQPTPTSAVRGARVELRKVGGSWMISTFDVT